MSIPALTEPHTAAPNRARRRSVGRVWDAFVVFWWIGLAAIAFAVVGAQLFGALRNDGSAAGSPILMALSSAEHTDANYVDHVEWSKDGNRTSLRVYPTAAGRQASRQFDDPAQAWAQVVKLAPNADSRGMREQFVCHWRFAEFGQPGKTSWNIEPWRPQVDDITMIAASCNPGGNEESL